MTFSLEGVASYRAVVMLVVVVISHSDNLRWTALSLRQQSKSLGTCCLKTTSLGPIFNPSDTLIGKRSHVGGGGPKSPISIGADYAITHTFY